MATFFWLVAAQGQTLGEGLDITNVTWTTGGDAPWLVQTTNTHDGIDAVRSAALGSNQISWLEATIVGPATIRFWHFISPLGPGGFSFSWQFDNIAYVPLHSFDSNSSWFEAIYDLAAGTNVFRWTAHNHGAANSGFACLDDVRILPPRPLTITYEPTSQTNYSGESTGVFASAIGTPPIRYFWQKNGNPIPGATNSSHGIEFVSTNDAGTYSVIVSNSQGTITSSNAILTVIGEAPPHFTHEPASVSVYAGENVTLSGGVEGSLPITLQWFRNGDLVLEGVIESFWSGSARWLFVTNVSETDAGNYKFVATNEFGRVESSNAVLTVLHPMAPLITRHPRSIEVAEGTYTWMSVEATGTPELAYHWTKVGTVPPPPPDPSLPPTPGGNSYNPQYRVFTNATAVDAGIYFVTVSNVAGAVTSRSALLTILPPLRDIGSSSQEARAIQVTNHLAYLAQGVNGLTILNVSNPAAPQVLGAYNTAGNALDVEVSDGLAFVADYIAGVQIISVTNPAHPVRLGGYDTAGLALDVVARSNLVYVADSSKGLVILNVSNPALPTLAGSYSTNFNAQQVAVVGNTAFLSTLNQAQLVGWDSGRLVVDVSNPAQPLEVGRLLGYDDQIDTQGTLLFTPYSILSVTNPVQPIALGGFGHQFTNYPPVFPPVFYVSLAEDIMVNGDFAYITGNFQGHNRLHIFDIRDPRAPTPVAGCFVDGLGRVAVEGNRVYVTGQGLPLRIIETPFHLEPAALPTLSLETGPGMRLRIEGRHGFNYAIERANVQNWQWETQQTILLTNDSALVEVPSDSESGFFRVRQLE